MENKKVVLGLSGGVDSAVAARLLTDRGFDVACLYLDNGVGSPGAAEQAAGELGLPFFVRDIRAALEEKVCRPFCRAYQAGRTPSPCAVCNPTVKFPALLELADQLGARYVATGHYARAEGGRLLRGAGRNDQSYLMARLAPEQLERCIFPLGGLEKSQVRALAAQFGLTAAERPDSMELCFVPEGDYAAWMERRGMGCPEGSFVDGAGNVLGRHRGIHRYTLGQGSGLGISGPHKYYVSAIRAETNEVVLSDGTDLFTDRVLVTDLSLAAKPFPQAVTVRFRHSRAETPARVELLPGGEGVVHALAPVRTPAPGQLAVFYDGAAVAGSGWIK